MSDITESAKTNSKRVAYKAKCKTEDKDLSGYVDRTEAENAEKNHRRSNPGHNIVILRKDY